jgi:hypothetical protein
MAWAWRSMRKLVHEAFHSDHLWICLLFWKGESLLDCPQSHQRFLRGVCFGRRISSCACLLCFIILLYVEQILFGQNVFYYSGTKSVAFLDISYSTYFFSSHLFSIKVVSHEWSQVFKIDIKCPSESTKTPQAFHDTLKWRFFSNWKFEVLQESG